MADGSLRLRGNLSDFEVALNDGRDAITVTSGGKTLVCRMTQFGWVCSPKTPPGSGGGQGPVLQVRVTEKRIFARELAPRPSNGELAARTGFQRHSL